MDKQSDSDVATDHECKKYMDGAEASGVCAEISKGETVEMVEGGHIT